MPALYGRSKYLTKWMLWQHFANDLPLERSDTTRMKWGRDLQKVILERTAYEYRLRMRQNIDENRYIKRGRIGHTRDGRMFSAQRGRINVEAKNVDWFIYNDDWSEIAAPPEYEIQLQVGMYVDQANEGIIAVLVGGNDQKYYERAPNLELYESMREETARFFQSIKRNKPPEVAGMPVELPMLAMLYPETDPGKVLERFEDRELRDILREYRHARENRQFYDKRVESLAPKIIAIAQDCSLIRCTGIEAKISKSLSEDSLRLKATLEPACRAIVAWATQTYGLATVQNAASWPSELRDLYLMMIEPWEVSRRGGIRTTISPKLRLNDPPLPGDDIAEVVAEEGARMQSGG